MTEWKGWKAVVRDVVIIWLLTAIGGFIIGVTIAMTGRSTVAMLAVGLSNIFFGTIGFCISGCMIKDKRWNHLVIVAIFVWLTSIINIFLGFASLIQWLSSIIAIFIMTALGGGLSYIFRKPSKDEVIVS